MKKIPYTIILLVVLIFSTLLINVSCDEEVLVDNEPDQLFRPASFNANVNEASVTFSWIPIGNARYQLELSKDSLSFQQDLQTFDIEGGTDIYKVEDLWSNSLYSARIKAVSIDGSISDSEYKQLTFTTGTENVFYNVDPESLGSDQVVLKWKVGTEVSHITVSSGEVDFNTITLTNSDVVVGQKLIEGLTSGTEYTFKIYQGEKLRGSLTITTN